MTSSELDRATDYCHAHVDLLDLPADYGYPSLTLRVIDAIYSINAHYTGVLNVIARYCAHCGISQNWPDYQRPVPRDRQQLVSELVEKMQKQGVEAFTLNVFQNQQRTSTRSGILKGEAIYEFALVLQRMKIECVQDLPDVVEEGAWRKRFSVFWSEFRSFVPLFSDAGGFRRFNQAGSHDYQFLD